MKLRLVVMATAVAASTVTYAPPANAAVYVFVMTGSGVILPGLTAVPTAQVVGFAGSATYVSTGGGPGSYACDFNGEETGSTAVSLGSLDGNCGPAGYVNVAYVRVGPHLTAVAVAVGGASSFTHWDCVWTPNDTNPTRTYSMVCATALHD